MTFEVREMHFVTLASSHEVERPEGDEQPSGASFTTASLQAQLRYTVTRDAR